MTPIFLLFSILFCLFVRTHQEAYSKANFQLINKLGPNAGYVTATGQIDLKQAADLLPKITFTPTLYSIIQPKPIMMTLFGTQEVHTECPNNECERKSAIIEAMSLSKIGLLFKTDDNPPLAFYAKVDKMKMQIPKGSCTNESPGQGSYFCVCAPDAEPSVVATACSSDRYRQCSAIKKLAADDMHGTAMVLAHVAAAPTESGGIFQGAQPYPPSQYLLMYKLVKAISKSYITDLTLTHLYDLPSKPDKTELLKNFQQTEGVAKFDRAICSFDEKLKCLCAQPQTSKPRFEFTAVMKEFGILYGNIVITIEPDGSVKFQTIEEKIFFPANVLFRIHQEGDEENGKTCGTLDEKCTVKFDVSASIVIRAIAHKSSFTMSEPTTLLTLHHSQGKLLGGNLGKCSEQNYDGAVSCLCASRFDAQCEQNNHRPEKCAENTAGIIKTPTLEDYKGKAAVIAFQPNEIEDLNFGLYGLYSDRLIVRLQRTKILNDSHFSAHVDIVKFTTDNIKFEGEYKKMRMPETNFPLDKQISEIRGNCKVAEDALICVCCQGKASDAICEGYVDGEQMPSKPEPDPEPEPQPAPQPEPDPETNPKPEPQPEPKPNPIPEPQPEKPTEPNDPEDPEDPEDDPDGTGDEDQQSERPENPKDCKDLKSKREKELCEMSKVQLDVATVDIVLSKIRRQFIPAKATGDSITYLARIVSSAAALPLTVQQRSAVLKTIDSALLVENAVFERSALNTERSLRTAIEHLVENATELSFLDGSQMAIHKAPVDCGNPDRWMGLSDHPASGFGLWKEDGKADVSIRLQNSGLCSDDDDEKPSSYFIIHRNAKLFPDSSKQNSPTDDDRSGNGCEMEYKKTNGIILTSVVQNAANPKINAKLEFKQENYEIPPHGELVATWWDPGTQKWSAERQCSLQLRNGKYEADCDHLTNFAMLVQRSAQDPVICDTVLNSLTFWLAIFSAICLLLLCLIYATRGIPKLRDNIYVRLINSTQGNRSDFLSVLNAVTMAALFLGYVLLTDQSVLGLSQSGCSVAAAFTYVFFLSSALICVFQSWDLMQLCVSSSRMEWLLSKFVKWYIVLPTAYGIPVLIALIAGLSYSDFFSRDDGFCWVRVEAILYAVIIPITLMLLNSVAAFVVFSSRAFPSFFLFSLFKCGDSFVRMGEGQQKRGDAVQKFVALICLQFSLGIPWVLQYPSAFDSKTTVWHWLFGITIGLTGIFALAIYLYGRAVAWRKHVASAECVE